MYGFLPILQLKDGRQLAESYAIARFLARKYNLAGRDEWEKAKVDELADMHKDVSDAFAAAGVITEQVNANVSQFSLEA